MKKNKIKLSPTIRNLIRSNFSPHFDPNGSWTGVCDKTDDIPIQDADDL